MDKCNEKDPQTCTTPIIQTIEMAEAADLARQWTTCLHESGHLAVAALLVEPENRVEMEAFVSGDRGRAFFPPAGLTKLTLLVVYAAGEAAEQLLVGRIAPPPRSVVSPTPVAEADAAKIKAKFDAFCVSPSDKVQAARLVIEGIEEFPDKWLGLHTRAGHEAARAVQQVPRLVVALADILFVDEYVGGSQIEALIACSPGIPASRMIEERQIRKPQSVVPNSAQAGLP